MENPTFFDDFLKKLKLFREFKVTLPSNFAEFAKYINLSS